MPDSELSEREREILRLVATGASNKEVAQQLSISTNTVKVHLRNIFAKIGVVSRTEAALYAIRAGLVQVSEAPHEQAPALPASSEELPGIRPASYNSPAVVGTSRIQSTRSWGVLALAGIAVIALISLVAVIRQPSITAIASPEAPTAPPRWRARSPFPTARSALAAAVYQNQIYSIGGDTGHGVTGVVERYDSTSDSWTTLSSKPTPVADISAAVLGGRIYVPGGRLDSDPALPTDVLEVYDPHQDLWESRAKLPEPISAYALASFEGKLYLFGGWDGSRFLDAVYEYDPERNLWRTLTAMPRSRGYGGAAVVGGKIYVMGGYDGKDALVSNDVYLPEREGGTESPWMAGSQLPIGRYAMGVVSISDNIFIIGGVTTSEGALPPLEYLQQDAKWIAFESPFPEKWEHMAAVAQGMYIYGVGGTIDRSLSSQNMAYQALYTILIPSIR